ncbi:MAG: sigma-70 family RNA polymerase sigma factor [Thermoleophilaceae bacterium]|nr:sigma-70 family RNA polymerase sigma factor [Thermoleophilaceae bacterium]
MPGLDSGDLERLYRSSRDDVFAYVAGMLHDRAGAEDVTALAFERAFRSRGRFDAKRGDPRSWLFGIARNAALDELRRRSRGEVLDAEPERISDAGAGDNGEDLARRETLREALARLPQADRELVVLKFHAGLANGEIAAVVGMSESNVGTRLHRSLGRLKEHLA